MRIRYEALTSPTVAVTALLIWMTRQLHAHLSGSISRKCLHDIWEQKKSRHPTMDLEDPLIAIPAGKVDYDIKTYGSSLSHFYSLH